MVIVYLMTENRCSGINTLLRGVNKFLFVHSTAIVRSK